MNWPKDKFPSNSPFNSPKPGNILNATEYKMLVLLFLLSSEDDSYIKDVSDKYPVKQIYCYVCTRENECKLRPRELMNRATKFITFSDKWEKDIREFWKLEFLLCDEHYQLC